MMKFGAAYEMMRSGTLAPIDGVHQVILTHNPADPDWDASEFFSWICSCTKGGSEYSTEASAARRQAVAHKCIGRKHKAPANVTD